MSYDGDMFCFQWHLTDRCNLRCRHCYQDSDVSASELTLSGWKDLATRIFTELGDEPVGIDLTGGEPLLIRDLAALAAHLHSFGNLARLGIISNGSVADVAQLRQLAAFPRLSMLKLSVESGRDDVNDAIRGPGSLARVRGNIPTFVREFPGQVTLMMTLSRANLGSIGETVEFAREMGVAGLMFERFIPLGTGVGMAEAVLSAEDWHDAVRTITNLAGHDVDLFDLAAYRAFWLWFDRSADDNLEGAFCNLGPDSMALMPDGTVFPCRRLGIPVGNLCQEPFSVIRARLAGWAPATLRPRLHGDLCGVCSFDDCPGCRALARALTGDPLADDPQCELTLI